MDGEIWKKTLSRNGITKLEKEKRDKGKKDGESKKKLH